MSPRGPRFSFPRIVLVASWGSSAVLWLFFLTTQQFLPTPSWLLDWHVYAAGATDLLERDLYYVPLESAHRLPIAEFNHPPLAAVLALPLLLLPDSVGGTLFVVLNVLAVAATSILMAQILGVRHPLAWGGFGFLLYTAHPWFRLAFLGNNTPMTLLLVVAFTHQLLRDRERVAGSLLGVAIGLKLWPAALLPVLIRERRWSVLLIACAVAAVSAAVPLAWLGPNVIAPAADAMQARAIIEPDNPVFFVSWLRETQEWWPWWGAYAVALALVAIPATGLLGIGLGLVGGMALIPNLWRTYLPTMVVAALFIVHGMRRRAESQRTRRVPRRDEAPDSPAGRS
jgi:hypothetical protein